ncbi:hypothetical protein CC78DRAFT_573700 [Lojkania enalia]|uniref:DUF7892 domain-containing protein n=1 Tax=Lojkania enalia TaxID=147567 RepID=A0A9P4NBY2_9PLEO|nr:hypothetical protein CC78DRAFT_573700 [Didymosphaeria enalia]
MEEREPSIASSTDFYESDRKPDTPADDAQNNALPTKRKAESLESVQDKKRRVESTPPSSAIDLEPCAGLPPAIWQHIFLSCPLTTLGRLLQVNRSFHSYLAHVRTVPSTKPESGFLRLLKSESIWAAARNAVPKKPPKPLPGFSELQMWQLVWSKKCQFCEKQSSFIPGEKVWQQGPGASGVRTVWPFAVRTCGPCLIQRSQTDSSLLFSDASVLRPALPFAFITTEQHYIPAYTLQSATTPAGVDIAKYYYKEHVDVMLDELKHAQSLGTAAAEEWFKGLDARGKERMKAAENWERWEVKYQWWLEHEEPKRAVSLAPSTASTNQQPNISPTRHAPSPVVHAPTPASKYLVHSLTMKIFDSSHSRASCIQVPNLTTVATASQYPLPRPTTIPPQVFTPQPVLGGGAPTSRGERNLHDANEAKASRKADIERRCQQLNPPIPPNILRHMDSFKAAIQISQPMTDYAWSVLQPRLLAQLPAAKQVEEDHSLRVSSLASRAADRRQQDASSKEVKEVLDREWEELQKPIRDRLSVIADDFINRDWDHGRAVTYENTPKFAVDLLMYVRRIYYNEVMKEEGAPAQSQQERDSRECAEVHHPKLVLENMKWVYDNKLKPLTEQFRKELFLCHGNGCEGNARFYGFEGVIQHFGAKHTNTFSVGNVVVAWREAEWPEETPFHPDPISVKHSYNPASTIASHGHSNYSTYYSGYSRAGTSTPHIQPHLPPASPSPYQRYGSHYNGPFAPPHTSTTGVQGYEFAHSYGAPVDSYTYHAMATPSYSLQAGNKYIPSPATSNVTIVPPPAIQTPGHRSNEPPPQNGASDSTHRTSLYDKQVSTVIQMAEEIWKQTSGVKDLPSSVRIYVLLQRVIFKFQLEFNHEPTLNQFLDALSSHQILEVLKDASGLSCKACQDGFFHQSSSTYSSRLEERKTYTVLNLFLHFKSHHLAPQASGYGNGHPPTQPDWKEDMIELPSDRLISGLIHAPGMDDDKLHMIATVFPRLFPTPLPRIGVIEPNGVPSPANSASKDSKDASKAGGTPGVLTDKSGTSSLAASYPDSPRPPIPSEDEYDPLRPALPAQVNQYARATNRKYSYQVNPPHTDRRPRYYAEPRYYVGHLRDPNRKGDGANATNPQLPRDHIDDNYPGPHQYMELGPSTRILRESGHPYEDYHGSRSLYREPDAYYDPGSNGVVYARPLEGFRGEEYEPYLQEVRYFEDNDRRMDYSHAREPRSEEISTSRAKAEADRFLEELVPSQPSVAKPADREPALGSQPKLPAAEPDANGGPPYTPPPLSIPPADDQTEQFQSLAAASHTAPSTISNGSRFEDYRPAGRQVPTPDSAGGPKRSVPYRRRERYHEHVPSRYSRYMSITRDDPYARGASMSRSQSRRYERYEQQRRRLDKQDIPQPSADRDYDPPYSRDQSVDQAHPEDPYHHQIRHVPRERDYVPVHEGHQVYPPSRVRYARPEDPRATPPVYIDEYGYEIIRMPREHRQPRGPNLPHPPTRYVTEHDSNLQYVPISYNRPPQQYDDRPNSYVYYEERERAPPRRPGPGPTLEPESEPLYETPEIKVENAPVNPVEGL